MEQSISGRILRDLRGGASAETVAVAVGISAASVYNYEAGQVPRRRIQYRLAEHFGMKPEDIWENAKEETNHEQEHQA